MKLYVKYDNDGFLTDVPATVNQDGYTEVNVQENWVIPLLSYPTKFRYNGTVLLNPGNLPKEDTVEAIANLEAKMNALSTDNASLNAQLSSLIAMIGGAE